VLPVHAAAIVESVFLFLVLFFLSAFFSGSETAMMSVNRYRLRHCARKGDRRAQQIVDLLKRPDRLLGVVLIGNTFCNVLVSSVVTLFVVRSFGEVGVLPATIILTIIILIFAETAPKTVAAFYPQWFARKVSPVLSVLRRVLYPLVWLVNFVANGFLQLFGMKMNHAKDESLSSEELSTLVREASGQLPGHYQEMLLSILSLEQVDVGDILVPRSEVVGIDIERPWSEIKELLRVTRFGYLPVYREHIDRVEGVLRVQDLVAAAAGESLSKESVLSRLRDVYFVPEKAELSQQMVYFQQKNQQMGLVVNEYGDILGLITLQDILEEIVGQFAGSMGPVAKKLDKQADGSYLIDAGIGMRDLNRLLGWSLPVEGPNTLSGVIIDRLGSIPSGPKKLTIDGHRIEIISMDGATVDQVRVWAAEDKNASQDVE
jgi:Mg2+/Co2+ transporter CorB